MNELLEQQWHISNHVPYHEIKNSSRELHTWQGDCSHIWQASKRSRLRGQGNCPYCNNRKALKGFNDITTTHPEATRKWSPNNTTQPYNYLAGSDHKALWQCEQGHEWLASIFKVLKQNTGCPICNNSKIIPGVNDIKTTHPKLYQELHPTKNSGLDYSQIGVNYSKKVWWQCEKKHEWFTTPNSRFQHNAGCSQCHSENRSKNYIEENNSSFAFIKPELIKLWDENKNNILPNEVSYGSETKIWWLCEKKHSWRAIARDISKGQYCPECQKTNNVSAPEKEIKEWLTQHVSNIETSNRSILDGSEIDIYLPEQKVGIEYNGLYWHSKKDKNYHYNKYVKAKTAGIKLIQIWEDDWNNKNKKQLIKNFILYNINQMNATKIPARKLTAKNATYKETQKFLNTNHIQGEATGSIYYTLEKNNKTYAAIVAKKQKEGTYTIERYATLQKYLIQGGFTKLLKAIQKEHPEIKTWMTFSDNTISYGELYKQNKFTQEKEIPADYKYIINHHRVHKFSYRIKNFKNNPNLKYEEGLTESQLAELNKIPKIWDAGKIRWIKNVE